MPIEIPRRVTLGVREAIEFVAELSLGDEYDLRQLADADSALRDVAEANLRRALSSGHVHAMKFDDEMNSSLLRRDEADGEFFSVEYESDQVHIGKHGYEYWCRIDKDELRSFIVSNSKNQKKTSSQEVKAVNWLVDILHSQAILPKRDELEKEAVKMFGVGKRAFSRALRNASAKTGRQLPKGRPPIRKDADSAH